MRMAHSRTRAEPHLLEVSSQCRLKYQREEPVAHSERVDESGILVRFSVGTLDLREPERTLSSRFWA
jgi:hypothetical protein